MKTLRSSNRKLSKRMLEERKEDMKTRIYATTKTSFMRRETAFSFFEKMPRRLWRWLKLL